MADFRRATAPLLATLSAPRGGAGALAASGGPALPPAAPGVLQTGVAAGR
jgi:hypothetical protein